MIEKAYLPICKYSDFWRRRTDDRAGPPKVVQEVLADLKNSHLIESDRGLVVGVDGGNGHRRPCGWVGQGHVVGAVRHEHPAVRHVLFDGGFVIWINLILSLIRPGPTAVQQYKVPLSI